MATHDPSRGPGPRRHVLDLYLAETRQVFNSMDPSPFQERRRGQPRPRGGGPPGSVSDGAYFDGVPCGSGRFQVPSSASFFGR
jgi:hypothetical protein